MPNETGKHVEQPVEPETVELDRKVEEAPSLGRRRLIKGAAAGLPLVFTLRSGTAMAMTTLGCMQDSTRQKPPVAIIPQQRADPSGVSWLRQKLQVRLVKLLDPKTRKPIEGRAEFKIYQARAYRHSEEWFTEHGKPIFLTEVHLVRDLPDELGAAFVEYNGRHVDIVRVSPKKGGGRPITTSCWTSFVVRPSKV